ncbi:MAG: hypothetical protein JRJ49_03550 [Deltaproteobacteria bacterium]|nr:hypothetical protein [Deltaproteobacteria bacterium]
MYAKLQYAGFNFYEIISIDKNKGLNKGAAASVDNISNYLGADYMMDFNIFKLTHRIGLLTIYNSDSHITLADAGVKLKTNITDNIDFTDEIKFSEVIKNKKTDKNFFDNLITNEAGLNLRYKKITAGLIYGFSNGDNISSD